MTVILDGLAEDDGGLNRRLSIQWAPTSSGISSLRGCSGPSPFGDQGDSRPPLAGRCPRSSRIGNGKRPRHHQFSRLFHFTPFVKSWSSHFRPTPSFHSQNSPPHFAYYLRQFAILMSESAQRRRTDRLDQAKGPGLLIPDPRSLTPPVKSLYSRILSHNLYIFQ